MFSYDVPLLDRIFYGSRINLLVLGRIDIGKFVLEAPYIVISITDPERPEATLQPSPFLRATLRLSFHDKGKRVKLPELEAIPSADEAEVIMTEQDAEKIIAFVRENLDHVKLIVCQCEAGMSRSAAIAAAISRMLQGEDEFFFEHYWPNRWVYQKILEASQ